MKGKKEIFIGVVVLFALIVSYYGIIYLKNSSFKSTSKKLFVITHSAEDILPNMHIIKNGLQVGRLEKIEPLNNTYSQFLLTIYLHSNLQVPKNSTLLIQKKILKGTELNLIFSNHTTLTENGDTLILKRDQDDIIAEITKKSLPLIDSLSVLISATNRMTQTSIVTSLKNIELITDNIKNLSFEFKHAYQHIANGTKNADIFLDAINKSNKDITSALVNIKNLTDKLDSVPLVSISKNLDSAIVNFKNISQKVDNNKGSLGLLLNDKSLYHNIDTLTKELSFLTKDLKKHPNKYISFSVFGKKYKEQKDTASVKN